jgi:predicted O-methyltransferase YrrM
MQLAPISSEPQLAAKILSGIDDPFRSALLSMYRNEPQTGFDGQTYSIDGNVKISPSQGKWLFDLCVSLKPARTIEIGLAYGFSTLFFLAAIANNRIGHHTAVDPFQNNYWHGIGAERVRFTGMDSKFTLMEDYSTRAATDLARKNITFDLIFIDGNHRFDDVLTDFYLYAPLCKIGGGIIFDDLWMPSIKTVVGFIRSNRTDFIEIATPQPNITVFGKVSEDARPWDNFHDFFCNSGKS